MRLVNIDQLTPGMRLGDSIHGRAGQTLLARGAALTDSYVATLRTMGVPAVYIADPDTADVEIPQPISPEAHARVLRNLAQVFEQVCEATEQIRKSSMNRLHQNPQSDRLVRAIASCGAADRLYAITRDIDLIMDQLGNLDTLVGLNSIKTHDLYTFQHSIDVTVLGLVLARRMGWDWNRTRAFGVGCLLHDIGKVVFDPGVLNQPGPLTPEAFERLKGHTTVGYEVIRGLAPRLGSLAPLVAYQHHEREDGSGYPRGLKGTNGLGENPPSSIHDFGTLSAVADVYDAMSSHRPYRRAVPVDQVVETIGLYAGNHLNAQAVKLFLSIVPPYPVCSAVAVLTGAHAGCRGVVVRVSKRDLSRPVVRILFDPHGERRKAVDLDLAIEGDVQVQSVRDPASPVHSLGSGEVKPRGETAKAAYTIPPAVLRVLRAC
ncbi:MAG TPA: HD domain-containing phosphohydrolase [Tepidisphaeraceae bacterium]